MIITTEKFLQLNYSKGLQAKYLRVEMCDVYFSIKNTRPFKTFRKHGFDCACCGAKAKHFVLEKHIANPNSKTKRKVIPRLTLVAVRADGKLVRMTCDHIIPISRGGSKEDPNNFQPMCEICNSEKGSMLPSEQTMGSRNWWNNIDPSQFANEPNPYLIT